VDYIAAQHSKHAGPKLPIPLTSHSSLTLNAGNESYLHYGLWKVHPLADPRLYAYMQTLPLRYFADKLLLRIYAKARRIPKNIYMPEVNEDFRDVDIEAGERLKEIIAYMLDDSILVKSGLLEKQPLHTVYQRFIQHQVADEGRMSLLFQNILHTELNLRSLGVTSL
jgi:hypothetical protein